MEYVLFFYNIFTTLLYGVCAFGFLLLYRRSANRRDLWVAMMFFAFILDLVTFAMIDFIPEFSELYRQMRNFAPYMSNLVTIAIMYTMRMVFAGMLDDRPGTNERLLQLFLFVLLFLTTVMASAWGGRLCYLLLNQGAMAAILVRGFIVLFRRRDRWPEKTWRRHFWLYVVVAALHLGGAVERFADLFDPERNTYRGICYELFGLVCVVVGLWFLFTQLGKAGHSVSDQELMELFVRHYALTRREAELLPMLLEGADNAAIAEKSCISLNTVKVHTHNIYQKLGVERRGQLSGCLAEFKKQYQD